MRCVCFSRAIPLLISVLIFPQSISLQASELFAVGKETTEYFDGSAWTQLYGAKHYEQQRLLSVWGASDADIYAVGANGTIAHYDGNAWNDMASGTSVLLESVWGSSGSDIFVVGAEGTILHFDGIGWSAMSSGTTNALYDVWGTSDNDVYAVGSGIVLRFNGSIWTEVDVGLSANFKTVWSCSSGEAYIGYSIDVSPYCGILYYSGTKWRNLSSVPIEYAINDIWGTSADDVFFSCGGGYVLHYNGANFTTYKPGNDDLRGISGINGNDIYVSSASRGVVFHFDGSAWTSHEIYAYMYLYDIFAVSTDNVVAVGSNVYTVNIRAKIYQFDGVDWSYMMWDSFPEIEHVWAGSSDNIFVVGKREFVNNIVYHYDGIGWTETAPVPGTDQIQDMWGTSDDDVFATTWGSTILRYDGISWSVMADFSNQPRSMWINSSSDIYVLDGAMHIHHYNGSDWSVIADAPYLGPSSKIYGSAGGEMLVIGYFWPWGETSRVIASYYDGSEWTTMTPYEGYLEGQDVTSIWGYSADDAYFTIADRIYHFDGVGVSGISTPIGFGWAYDAWGDSDGNVYFVNGSDEIHSYDGSEWSTIYTGNEKQFSDIWGSEESATHASELPAARLTLNQNYPNPFNPTTAIEYYLEKKGHVTLAVYSVSGQRICTLLDKFQTQGTHSVQWRGVDDAGRPVASGIYFCRIKTSSGTQTKKLVLAR